MLCKYLLCPKILCLKCRNLVYLAGHIARSVSKKHGLCDICKATLTETDSTRATLLLKIMHPRSHPYACHHTCMVHHSSRTHGTWAAGERRAIKWCHRVPATISTTTWNCTSWFTCTKLNIITTGPQHRLEQNTNTNRRKHLTNSTKQMQNTKDSCHTSANKSSVLRRLEGKSKGGVGQRTAWSCFTHMPHDSGFSPLLNECVPSLKEAASLAFLQFVFQCLY